MMLVYNIVDLLVDFHTWNTLQHTIMSFESIFFFRF